MFILCSQSRIASMTTLTLALITMIDGDSGTSLDGACGQPSRKATVF